MYARRLSQALTNLKYRLPFVRDDRFIIDPHHIELVHVIKHQPQPVYVKRSKVRHAAAYHASVATISKRRAKI